jgi:hypothetical protein
MQPRDTHAELLRGEGYQLISKWSADNPAMRHEPYYRPLEAQRPAGEPFADPVLRVDSPGHRAAFARRHEPFPETSLRLCRLKD